jgi:hypothetical protein
MRATLAEQIWLVCEEDNSMNNVIKNSGARLLLFLMFGLVIDGGFAFAQDTVSEGDRGPNAVDISGFSSRIAQIAREYHVGTQVIGERIGGIREIGGDIVIFTIGTLDDCSQYGNCLTVIFHDKIELPFVTPCRLGLRNLSHIHRPDGQLVFGLEFVCDDKSKIQLGISRSSISITPGSQ